MFKMLILPLYNKNIDFDKFSIFHMRKKKINLFVYSAKLKLLQFSPPQIEESIRISNN